MVDVLWNLLRFYFFDGNMPLNSCLYLFALDCFLPKKTVAKWLAAGSYFFLVLWIATEGYFFRMSLEDLIRLWTSLEFLTKTYQLGFYLNILLGILLIIKYREG